MNTIFNDIVFPAANELLRRAELPQKKEVSEHRKNVFWSELRSYQFEHDINGKVVIKDSHGFMVEDEHGWPLTVNEVVKSTFDKFFEVSKWPQTEDEYWKELRDPKITSQRRRELVNFWEARK